MHVLWYGAVRKYVHLYVHSVIHNPCGQDIARTIWPRMLKLSVYTLYGQRKKPNYFQGQKSNFKVTRPFFLDLVMSILFCFYCCFRAKTNARGFE